MASPVQRTLKYLRDNGYKPGISSGYNFYAGKRWDLYGIMDLVAVKDGVIGILGVQVTTYNNVPARIKKALVNEVLPVWLKAGNRFVVHGWKKGVRGIAALREVNLRYDADSKALQEDHSSGGT